jgi:hypothetical protein
MKLPEYQPDGSLPPLPTEPVLGSDLEGRYRISKAALHKRRAAIPHAMGTRKGRFTYFSPEEVFQLDAVHYYVKAGFSIEDIAAGYQEGAETTGAADWGTERLDAVDVEATGTTSDLATVSPSMRQFSNEMAKHISDALEKYVRPPSDPLRTHRLLEEAAEKQWEITSKMLANMLEMKIGTIHSFERVEQRHGFEITKSNPGKWKVRRLSDEELQAA